MKDGTMAKQKLTNAIKAVWLNNPRIDEARYTNDVEGLAYLVDDALEYGRPSSLAVYGSDPMVSPAIYLWKVR